MLLPRAPRGAVFQRQDVLRGIRAVLLACLCPCRSASRGSLSGFRSASPHFTTLGFFFPLPMMLGASPPKGRVWAIAEGSWWHAAEAQSSVTLGPPLGSGGSPLQPATAEHPSQHLLQPSEGQWDSTLFFSSKMTFPSSSCEVRTWHRCAAPTSRHASPWAGSGAARVSQNRGNDSLFPGNKCPRAQLVCLILGQPAAAISPASLGRAGRVFGCLQSNKQSAGASEATISKTPRWAGRRSLKQNCQSKELVSLATLVVEIGLRVGAKKHAQKSGEQLLPVRGAESPQTRSRAGGEMKFWEVQGWEMKGDGQNGVLWGRRRMPQPWKCRRPQDGRGSGQPGVVQGVLEVPPHPSPDPPRT